MGFIYLITNTINKKQYVGQTLCNDINKRWNQHKRKDKNSIGKYLLSAYEKYGVHNFKFQIICICFDEDSNRFEEEYIKKFNTLSPNGYNLTSGGKNGKQDPELTKQRADKMRGKKLRSRTDEEKKYLSERLKGEKNPNFNKPISEEQKKKISDTLKMTLKNKVSENRLKGLEKGRRPKRVGKYDNTILLESYISISEAARKNNISYQHISKVCHELPKYKTAGGFIWKFLSD